MPLALPVLNRAPGLRGRTLFVHPTGASLHGLPWDPPAFPTPPPWATPSLFPASVSFVDRFICVVF